MATWYRAAFGKINQAEVSRSTESSVWTTDFRGKQRRSARITSYECFFPTFNEAKDYLIDEATKELSHAQDRVNRALRDLADVEAMEPPK